MGLKYKSWIHDKNFSTQAILHKIMTTSIQTVDIKYFYNSSKGPYRWRTSGFQIF